MTPLIKWVGGKRWLVDTIRKRMPSVTRDYYEPFVGGAALFFDVAGETRELEDLVEAGGPKVRRAGLLPAFFLSDANPDLISMYSAIAARPEEVSRALLVHARAHAKNQSRRYELVRRLWNRRVGDIYERAAMFLYLNRTCFNGLWRVNRQGEFNVPMGRYEDPGLVAVASRIHAASRVLKLAKLSTQSAFDCPAGAGDFVYFDPPYDPISSTSSFTSYDVAAFGDREQRTLARITRELAAKGAHVMVSNSNTKLIRDLYKGLHIKRVYRTGSINSNPSGRGRVAELLITTY